ncbi:MAG: T9SS type A sorting domain-containing protein [Bacteroidota bacterium]|nr:T9SS type A sorting domain-containing protein [Bacteroidota bacterium]
MKKIYTLIFSGFLLVSAFAQPGANDPSFNPGIGFDGPVYSTAIQSDGKIIVGGWYTTFNGTSRNRIARINADGTLDTGFDPGTGFIVAVTSTVIQSDGKIIVGGQFTDFNGTARNHIARLNANGTLDLSFNPGTGFNNSVTSTAIQSNGKIIVGGYFTDFNGTSRNRIARLNAAGTIDATFNPGSGFNSWVNSIAIQSDGKIIVGGNFTSYNGLARNYIARLNANGTLDAGFNPGAAFNGSVQSITIQSDGKIIVGGWFSNSGTRNFIARLNADGTLDLSFDTGSGFNHAVYSTAIQSDGKIIVGGRFTNFNGTSINRISRLNADGILDTDFDPGTGFDVTVQSTVIQSDGKIIALGEFTSFNGIARNRITRLLGASSVGLVDNKADDKISAYPNPTSDLITLLSTKDLTGTVIKVFTLTGQLLTEKKVSSGNNYSLDLKDYTPGLYFIELNQNRAISRMKIMKK